MLLLFFSFVILEQPLVFHHSILKGIGFAMLIRKFEEPDVINLSA
jgi:hypothetical protein